MLVQPTKTATARDASADAETLVRQVYRALDCIEPLRFAGFPIRVQINDGVATLSGVVAAYPIKAQALQAARSVPGLKEVKDELQTDADLEIQITYALSSDPRTHQAAFGIFINATNGLVNLVGHVPTHGVAQAAENIAAGQPGVRAVSNQLQVAPGEGTGDAGRNEEPKLSSDEKPVEA